jgi:hypothetical protein
MSTVSQLRKDIDSGRTGDKIAWPDPAAAPLGTDEEAAGTPPSAKATHLARAREVERKPVQRHRVGGSVWLMIIIILVIAAVVVGALFVLI